MIEKEIGYGGKDRAEMKHQFRGTVDIIPVFRILDKEELEVRDRWMKVKSRPINNSFVIGHPVNGKIGYGTIGDFRGSWTTERVIQSENVYREWFYDDEFKDSSTTANWDTSNHRLTFASGDIAQSTSVYYNVTTVSQAILTADYSGTLSFWITADGGSHWESTNSGETHIFENTGQDLRWKASAVTSATINNLTIEIIT